MSASVAPAILLALAAVPAFADGQVATTTASIETERHFTTNALESPLAVSDWYTLLRGSLAHDTKIDGGHVRIEARFEASRYDRVDLEDDRSGQVSIELLRKLSPSIEAKAALSLAASDIGDDITIGRTVIGTRVRKILPGAALQLGADLGGGRTLVASASFNAERPGMTRIEGLAGSYRLEPDRLQADATLRYAQTLGRFRYGALTAARFLKPDHIGFPPSALGATMLTVQIEGAATAPNGATLQAGIGAQSLESEFGIYRQTRAAYEISAAMSLGKSMALRGTAFARFETAETDDPLASWLRRFQLECTFRVAEPLLLAAGAYREMKENLLLENRENGTGFYAEAARDLGNRARLLLRVDWSRTHKTVIEQRYDRLDMKVAFSKTL